MKKHTVIHDSFWSLYSDEEKTLWRKQHQHRKVKAQMAKESRRRNRGR